MKNIFTVLALAAFSMSAFAQGTASSYSPPQALYGQSGSTVTRAQVKKELADLEAVGYHPNADQINYPQNIQAAEQRVSAHH